MITTERLFIRNLVEEDRPMVFKLYRKDRCFENDSECQRIIDNILWEEITAENICNGIIFLSDTKEFVGKVCVQFTDRKIPEVGIDILENHRNKGYGPEAVVGFLSWFSKEYNINKFKVKIFKDNKHSIHVFEKLGAEFVKSAPGFNKELINKISEKLPDEDLSKLYEENINEYILNIPI